MAMKANAKKAAAARARMAKRARRQRFWKENKKRLTLGFIFFMLLVFAALFTPLGTDWYYGKIQNMRMAAPSRDAMPPGVVRDLYKLGVFYSYTFRKDDALRCYDEIATIYFGFTFEEYAIKPGDAFDKRLNAEIRKSKGEIGGPPFSIPQEEIRYVGYAIFRYGEIVQYNRSRLLAYNLYKDLYLDEIKAEYPQLCDADINENVLAYVQRIRGER